MVERRLAGAVLEVRDDHRNRIVLLGRRHRAARQDRRPRQQHNREHRRRSHDARRKAPCFRDDFIRIVESGERCAQIRGGLKTRGRITVQTSHDQRLDGRRNGLVMHAKRRHPLLEAPPHRVEAVFARDRRPRSR